MVRRVLLPLGARPIVDHDQTFRLVLIAGAVLVMPILAHYRVRAHATGERLDRTEEGLFILLTLRPVGLITMAGLLAFMIRPSWMAWSSVALPVWMRWAGVGLGVVAAGSLIWTFHTLGPNLTDTAVTRREHTLVTHGPYRWLRHPFYVATALAVLANALVATNWFLLAGGALTVLLLVLRTSTEEHMLIDRFGDAYRDYMAETGRFLPRLPLR